MPGFSVVLCARFVSPVVRFSEFNPENATFSALKLSGLMVDQGGKESVRPILRRKSPEKACADHAIERDAFPQYALELALRRDDAELVLSTADCFLDNAFVFFWFQGTR